MSSQMICPASSMFTQAICVLILLAYFLSAHIIKADSQNVRLPARFGKRAEEPDRESSNVNLIKLMSSGGEFNNGRQSSEGQMLSSLLSSPSLVPSSIAASLPSTLRIVLVPMPIDHKGNILCRVSNKFAAERDGPWL